MKARINSYMAVLLVTIAGAGAAMLIIHVAYANAFEVTFVSGGAAYAPLRDSILR